MFLPDDEGYTPPTQKEKEGDVTKESQVPADSIVGYIMKTSMIKEGDIYCREETYHTKYPYITRANAGDVSRCNTGTGSFYIFVIENQ